MTKSRKIKAFMRRKFPSYAGSLADTLYDQAMVNAVSEIASLACRSTASIGYSTKVKMATSRWLPAQAHAPSPSTGRGWTCGPGRRPT